MVEMKHTAGEWEVMGSSDPRFRTLAIKEFSEEQTKAPVIGIFDAEHRTIAYIATTAETVAEDEANARLIAAAPDLLAAAVAIANKFPTRLPSTGVLPNAEILALRAAISRATTP